MSIRTDSHSRVNYAWAIALAIAAFFAVGAQQAVAATLHVETTGADSGTCGPLGDPCLTVTQAVTNAASSDTVAIGTGTFPVTDSIRPGAKSLTIEGEGPTNTLLDGGNSNAYTLDGMLWFGGPGTTQIVRGIGFINVGKRAASTNRWAIGIQPSPSSPTNTIDATVENVHVTTGNPPGGQFEIAVMAANNNGSVVIDGLVTDNLTGNHILAERQRGAFTVRNSTFVRNATGTMIYDMLHGGPTWNSTGLHLYENNTFTATGAIRVVGGWDFGWNPTTSSYPAGVTIAGNTVTVPGIVNTNTAISATNAASTGTPTDGQISNLQITGNTVTGNPGNGTGILVSGQIDGAQITGNNVRDFLRGIYLARFAPVNPPYSCTGAGAPVPCPPTPHQPLNTSVTLNQIVGNGGGLVADPNGSIAASAINNWWGCNAGPGAAGCDNISQPITSSIDSDPWAVLTLTSDTSILPPGGSSGVYAEITSNSDGDPITPLLPDGSTIGFSGTNGGLSPTTDTTTDSVADSVFTSSGLTGRSAGATYDNATVTYAWSDVDVDPPVVNILTPQDNTTVANDVASTTLTYQVADFGDPNPVCNPANGSVVPLSVGLNTITVTCVDAFGNAGTDTVKVTRSDPPPPPSPPTPDPIDTLPACARDIVITNVVIKGSRYSQITGLARSKYVGQTVRINFRPSGSRTIGRATVRNDGTWSVVVRRPSSPSVGSNLARYRAVIGGQTTSWIKLSRRLIASRIAYSNGKLNVSGRVIRPVAPGRRLVVTRSDLCGRYTTVGTIAVKRDGRFDGSVATVPRADSPVPFIRLHVKVRRGGSGSNPNREFTTYSIVRPVPVLDN